MSKFFNIGNIFFTFFFIGVFAFCYFMFAQCPIFEDELYFWFFEDGIKFHKNWFYGSWFMEFINIAFYWIPHKLHINIQDYYSIAGALFKSFTITCLIYFYSKILRLGKINKINVIPFILLLFLLFVYFGKKLEYDKELLFIAGFFKYAVNGLLTVILCFYFYKYLKTGKINLVFVSFLAFITAACWVFAAGTLLTAFLLYLVYAVFKRKNDIVPAAVILLSLAAGTVSCISAEGYILHNKAVIGDYVFSYKDLFAFTKTYAKVMFLNIPFNVTAFIVLLVANITKKVRSDMLLFPCFVLAGVYLCLYTLVFCGTVYYDDSLWIEFPPPQCIVIIVYMLVWSMQYASIAEKTKIYVRFVVFILIACLLIPVTKEFFAFRAKITNTANNSYARDKIRMYWHFAGKKPIMPAFSVRDAYFFVPWEPEDVKNTRKHIVKEGKYENLERDYFPRVYLPDIKDMSEYAVITGDNKTAIEAFEACGGTIAEIYEGKYMFADLTNREFVLNNYSPDNPNCKAENAENL